jgi:hypothetical protein
VKQWQGTHLHVLAKEISQLNTNATTALIQ